MSKTMGSGKPIPADFEVYAREPKVVLMQRYNVGESTISRWRREAGIKASPGHPFGKCNVSMTDEDRQRQTRVMIDMCLNCTRPSCGGSCKKMELALRGIPYD